MHTHLFGFLFPTQTLSTTSIRVLVNRYTILIRVLSLFYLKMVRKTCACQNLDTDLKRKGKNIDMGDDIVEQNS